jgi:hypothetical protein
LGIETDNRHIKCIIGIGDADIGFLTGGLSEIGLRLDQIAKRRDAVPDRVIQYLPVYLWCRAYEHGFGHGPRFLRWRPVILGVKYKTTTQARQRGKGVLKRTCAHFRFAWFPLKSTFFSNILYPEITWVSGVI